MYYQDILHEIVCNLGQEGPMGKFQSTNTTLESLISSRNGRLESLSMFAQSVYLIFSAVYICKEAVEHFLLSAGEDAHHHGDHHHHAERYI